MRFIFIMSILNPGYSIIWLTVNSPYVSLGLSKLVSTPKEFSAFTKKIIDQQGKT